MEDRKRRRIERARKGGLGLLAKRGGEHFVQMGKLGGRPTWQDSLEKAKSSLGQTNKRNDTGLFTVYWSKSGSIPPCFIYSEYL